MDEVTTLRERRVAACDKIAAKCLSVPRFAVWFPVKEPVRAESRNRDCIYLEEFARCNRLRDSPLFYMRRRMNGKEGKVYGERNKEYRNTGMKISGQSGA